MDFGLRKQDQSRGTSYFSQAAACPTRPLVTGFNLKIVLGDCGQRMRFGLEIKIYNDKRNYRCSQYALARLDFSVCLRERKP